LHAGRDLARDVAILMDVCRALHFAHARGVVHRDVKPANVMVGTFGEVYLLDWGIAVGIDTGNGKSDGNDAPPTSLRELPRARDVRKLAGTPQYMAPEMAFPEGNIDARTDVYLAGAVLHELITGRAPHAGNNVEERLYRAHLSEPPQLDDVPDVPEEIADICRHAMSRDPNARYQSADELRAALAAFQSHAAARKLCEAAEERLATLLAMPPAKDAHEGSDAQAVFTECRFGFSLALRTWPGSLRAREGLERAIAGMAWREASAGHYDSARLLAAELDPIPPALAAHLDDLKRKRDAEAADAQALQRMQHERDVTIGSVERAFVVMGSATSWLLLLVAMHFLDRNGTYRAASGTFAVVMSALLLCIALAGVLAPRIRSTGASRAIYLTLLMGVAGIFSVHAVGWWFALPPAPMLAVGHTVLAATLLMVAAHDARLWIGAGMSALIVPAIVLAPAHVYLVSGIGCFVALAAFSLSLSRANVGR
jgi:eukaryotic-like serine/threonine-protein kinase